MKKPEIPSNESKRLKALSNYNILDTLPEEEYDAITKIAAEICNTPIALISLIDPSRQWFKSHHGLDATETPREVAFCAHAINNPDELLIVPDATKDIRFHDNPLTTDEPHVIFYAGAPLKTSDGFALGTLCVIDTKPRKKLSKRKRKSLEVFAKHVVALLELRKSNIKLKQSNKAYKRVNNQLKHFNYRLTHDLKTPIHAISSLVGLIEDGHSNLVKGTEVENYLNLIFTRTEHMETLVNGILDFVILTNEKIELVKFKPIDVIHKIIDYEELEPALNLNLKHCDQEVSHSKLAFKLIFQNLLVNSVKFKNKSKSTVWISLVDEQDHFHITYEDDGPGIEKQYWEKIFVMFETLNDYNSLNTGIGLATVKSIVDRIGGSISISHRSENKSGVLFQLRLPKIIAGNIN
ncbi:ATP-binding protein [Geojedonia litorea]|uniref:histidine kinase n=1 Tax=Geojedonia litorea TaxID=1268269 RepID=A0ABV9N6C6_9FLAO